MDLGIHSLCAEKYLTCSDWLLICLSLKCIKLSNLPGLESELERPDQCGTLIS